MTAPTFAQGSRSQLAFKAQTDFLTAATGNFTRARFSTHSLDLKVGSMESAEIRQDRQVEDFRHGQASDAGDINVDLVYSDHDWLWQMAMFGTFNASVLNIGTTPQYYSVEDGALDINAYRFFTGITCSRATLDVRPNQIVKASFSCIGSSMTATGGSQAGTLVSPSNNQPFDSYHCGVYPGGAVSGTKLAGVSQLTLNIDNGVGATSQVGYQYAQAIQFGRGRVTGTLSVYYQDVGFINNFINETEVGLDLFMTDPSGNNLNFAMPRIKYNGASVPVQNEQSRYVTLPFIALRDTSLGTTLTVTKS